MVTSTASKYAQALAEVAFESRSSEGVLKELTEFQELLQNAELQDALFSPALPFAAKRSIVEDLAARLSLREITLNFILVLLQNSRLDQFGEVLEAYQEVLDEHNGIVRGDVYYSRDLPSDAKDRLEEAIASWTGKKVKLRYRRDESLIGGLKVQIGSSVFDGSIRTQLDEIQRRLVSQ